MNKRILLASVSFLLASISSAQQVTPQVQAALTSGKQGSVVKLENFLTEKLPYIEYQKIIQPGSQYIISDDPEYIRVPEAIALQETVQPGTVRFYLYNVNGVKEPQKMDRKITTVIKNLGKQPMKVQMLRYSSQRPTTNYFLAGKNGLRDFFTPQTVKRVYTAKPGEAIPLDPQTEKYIVKYDELVHGFYEFLVDQPAQISVIQTDLKTSGSAALKRIKSVFPSKGTNAGRGLFGVSNYLIRGSDTLNTNDGVKHLVVADGDRDPWIVGIEGSANRMISNAGNYGVMYNIELKWKSTGRKGLALVTWNSRSDNQWCGGMANTMIVSGGKFKEGIIQLPSDELRVKGAPDAILIQIFKPDPSKEVQDIKLTYSPPGASCLPTPLVFIPVDL